MMKDMDRRGFLKLAGGGSVLAAASAAVPAAALLAAGGRRTLVVRASAGLPARPLPSMATHVLEGFVDLESGTGALSSRVLAGHPEPSEIALPGLSRMIRIIGADRGGARLRLRGVVDDRSQLRPGESPGVDITIDQAARTVRGALFGRPLALSLEG